MRVVAEDLDVEVDEGVDDDDLEELVLLVLLEDARKSS